MGTRNASKSQWEKALRESSAPSFVQRAIWMTLATYADWDTGLNITVSKMKMAERLGISRKTIERAVQAAIEQGWLVETRRNSSTGPKVYRLTIPAESGETVSQSPKVKDDDQPEREPLNVKPLRTAYSKPTPEADPEHYGYSPEEVSEIVASIQNAPEVADLFRIQDQHPDLYKGPGPVWQAHDKRKSELKSQPPEDWCEVE